jgi:uncharacterized protein (DUF1778 family)
MTEAELVAYLTLLEIKGMDFTQEELDYIEEIIKNPPEPNERLKKAVKEYNKIVSNKKKP